MQPEHFGILALEVYFPNQYVSTFQLAVPLPLQYAGHAIVVSTC